MNSDLRELIVLFFVFGGGFWVLAPSGVQPWRFWENWKDVPGQF